MFIKNFTYKGNSKNEKIPYRLSTTNLNESSGIR